VGEPTFASSGRDDVTRIPEADRVRIIVAGALVYGVALITLSPLWRALLFNTLRRLR